MKPGWLSRFFRSRSELTPRQTRRLADWQALPQADMQAPFEAARYVVVDVETSGLDIRKDRLIAIGAVAVKDGRIAMADSLDIVLQQDLVSDRANILIHGIGGDAQREGVPPAEALLDFLEYIGKDPLIAFHVAFDQTMIGRAIRTHLGFKFEQPWADLAYVAPALYPELARSLRSLDDWMEHFRIANYARHSALADALSSAELLLALRERLTDRGAASFRGLRDMERERRMLTHPM